MVPPGTLMAVLVGLGVAHLLVLLVQYRRRSTADRGDAPGEGRVEELIEGGPAGEAPDRDLSDVVTTPCPECHAINDAAYTFCRRCATRLSR